MSEADDIYVLDTGSSDRTVELLKLNNVKVTQTKIEPWRFDVARNRSLDLVPSDVDICVCTDLDEVFDTGWRQKLENIWENGINCIGYNYNWSLDKNNKPLVNFYIEKIHCRHGYKWVNAVHEVLMFKDNTEIKKYTDEITLNHYPDKTKSRSSYLPLLELSVKENPNNDRNMHYLGREYMYYGRWNECIDTLIKHLSLPSAKWKDERSASMRFIARSYIKLNRYEEAKMWFNKAIKESPYLREPYIEQAILAYQLEDYDNVIKYCHLALKIKEHTKSYINEPFSWDNTVYDLLSIAYYYKKSYKAALKYINKAIKMNNKDKRLLENKKMILVKLKQI